MKSIVVIPTYNEADNIGKLIEGILGLHKDISILVVDDNSSDGTGDIVDVLAGKNEKINIIHRSARLGLGTAYIAGFQYALKNGYELVITMDADFSHDPNDIPRLLERIQTCDVAIGSRYHGGVRILNWPIRRLILSIGANRYVRWITGLKVSDCTSGFRCYRCKILENLPLNKMKSEGYAFLVEMLFYISKAGFKITEVPIIFTERRAGQSKMSKKVITESMIIPWRLKIFNLLYIYNPDAKKTKGSNVITKKKFLITSYQFIKFGLVGALGFVINIAIFYFTNEILHIYYILCAIIAFLVAVINNFIWNKYWTFKNTYSKSIHFQFFKYLIVNLFSLGINLMALAALVQIFKMQILISQIIAVLCAMAINFIGSKIWVFK